VYFIAILDFKYDEKEEEQKFRRDVCLKDQDGDIFYDKLHFKFLQMPLFNKQAHELETHFDKWVYFLKYLEDFDHIPTILNEPIFQKGFEIAEMAHLSSDQYDVYLKSVLSYNEAKAVKDTAFFDGEKQGMEKGIEVGKIAAMQNAARILKYQGVAISVIALSTGLSEQDIEALK
jgi:predicted transposase/invertase (TIGR01784 family)